VNVQRVRTDDAEFLSRYKMLAGDIRRSLGTLEDLLKNAEAVPRDFIEDLQRAAFTAQDAAARAARLAIPKVR
jgi:hypothetical protein